MNRRLFFVLVLATVLMIPGALFANCGKCEAKADCAKACDKAACAKACDKAACAPTCDKCGQKCEKKAETKANCADCAKNCQKRSACRKHVQAPVLDNGAQAIPFLCKVTGEWRGLAETRNDRVQPESLKVVIWINADGTVTGRLGEWKLKDATITRTKDRTRQSYQEPWMITGTAEGMKTIEGAKNQVIISVNVNGTKAEGEIRGFAAEKKSGKVIFHRWNLTHLNLYPVK